MAAAEATPLMRLFSAKHEFPGEWHQFLHPEGAETPNRLALNLSQNRFPFPFRDQTISITQIDLYLKLKENQDNTLTEVQLTDPGSNIVAANFAETSPVGLPQTVIELSQPHEMGELSTWEVEAQAVTIEAIDDIFVVCHCTVS